MIGHRFDYCLPSDLDEAVEMLSKWREECSIIGGGTVLVSAMSAGQRRPKAVVDLRRLNLAGIEVSVTGLVIGATTTYDTLESSSLIQNNVPLLSAMAAEITGGPQIRHQGTIGGSSCHANPASDIPACLVALDSHMVVASTRGSRTIPASEFFHGAFRTALANDECLTQIIIPNPTSPSHFGYYKLKFCASSWPIVTAACMVSGKRDGQSQQIRICLGGAGPIPALVEVPCESWPLTTPVISELAHCAAAAVTEEWIDELAGPGYRRAVSAAVAMRAIQAAMVKSETSDASTD